MYAAMPLTNDKEWATISWCTRIFGYRHRMSRHIRAFALVISMMMRRESFRARVNGKYTYRQRISLRPFANFLWCAGIVHSNEIINNEKRVTTRRRNRGKIVSRLNVKRWMHVHTDWRLSQLTRCRRRCRHHHIEPFAIKVHNLHVKIRAVVAKFAA